MAAVRWRCGGEVLRWHRPEPDGVAFLPSPLSADTSGRSGERLAMVWTVKTSDGAEERRGTGEDGGGILRPGSLSSCFVCSALHHHMKEENEDEAGRMADRRGAALVLFLPGQSVHLLFPSLFTFVLSLYIIRCRYNKDNATN